MLDMISIFLNLLRFHLWPKMWSILENFPCALEKKVYTSAFGWKVIKISVSFISSNLSFKTCVSLLIFCFDDLSTVVSGVLESPTIIVLLSVSLFTSVSLCLMYWGVPLLGALDIYNHYVFLLDWSLDHYGVSFLISYNILYFKAYFIWYKDFYSSFLLLPIFMEYIFPSSHFESVCVFRSEMGFL